MTAQISVDIKTWWISAEDIFPKIRFSLVISMTKIVP